MIGLLQRVTHSRVTVGDRITGEIGPGLMVLIGVERGDSELQATRLLERILQYRVFNDADGRMNISLAETGGGLLLVPQFTLAADTRKGTRPGFSSAAPPDEGRRLFDFITQLARQQHPIVATGEFGAHMQVSLVNDGPVTFWLQISP